MAGQLPDHESFVFLMNSICIAGILSCRMVTLNGPILGVTPTRLAPS
jgi:hypothetical protein